MSRPPRIEGFDYCGRYRYFLTFCTFRRARLFENHQLAEIVILQVRRTAILTRFAVYAYCVMPDHVHLLVEGTQHDSDLRRFMSRLKQSSAQASRRVHRGPLWQEGYFDRVLRANDDAREIARYILENPVRAGLARHAGDYPHVGSSIWSIAQLLESLY